MGEMVERVANALREGGSYEDMARAAIEAMREPTDAMGAQMARVALTSEKWTEPPDGDPRRLTTQEAERINWSDGLAGNPARWYKPMWRIAIDAALSPTQSEPEK